MNDRDSLKQIRHFFENDEQYQRLLFEEVPAGYVLCRLSGEIMACNPAFARILGRENHEMIGMIYWDLTPVKYIAEERRLMNEAEKTGKYGPYEKEYMHREGHLVPTRVSGQILSWDGSTLLWANIEDISAQKQTEEKLKEKAIAFKEILSQIEFEKEKIKHQITGNVDRLILPALRKLRKKSKSADAKYFESLENNLLDLTASFGLKVSQERFGLTPTELEVCNLIKNGFRTKDIAESLGISPLTVETHRHRVRKKLGIRNKSVNLATYLQTI